MTIYKIHTNVYLDNYDKTYYHIFTISPSIKNDKLNNYLKPVPFKRLSPFDYPSPNEEIHHCVQAFLNPQNKNKYLEVKYTEVLFNLLIENGYTIEYELTKLIKLGKHQTQNNIICYASK